MKKVLLAVVALIVIAVILTFIFMLAVRLLLKHGKNIDEGMCYDCIWYNYRHGICNKRLDFVEIPEATGCDNHQNDFNREGQDNDSI